MNKLAFLSLLRDRLAGLPGEDIGRSMDYYSEMIDDRMEEGLSEEEAVRAIGPMDEVVGQILMETSLPKLVKAKVRRKRSAPVGQIVLLVLGSPIWLPLCVAALAIFLVLYLLLWVAVLVMYVVDLCVAAAGLSGLLGAFVQVFGGRLAQGAFLLGGGLACIGLAVLLFFGFNVVTKGVLTLSRAMLRGLKAIFIGRGDRL